MKKLLCFVTVYMAFLFSVHPVSAHSTDAVPYVQINGQYTTFYSIPSASLDALQLPNDQAPDLYLVNQPLTFTIDLTKAPFPPELLKKTTFTWDFGDGTKGNGFTLKHTYTKMGSYILTIATPDDVFESIFLNIVPNQNYQFPHAVIFVNGKKAGESASSPLSIQPGQTLQFDASESQAASSRIVSYWWDFGDGEASTSAVATHQYTNKLRLLFPLLRIKDANGFISDEFTSVQNDVSKSEQQTTHNSQTTNDKTKYLYIVSVAIIAGTASILILKKRHKPRRH